MNTCAGTVINMQATITITMKQQQLWQTAVVWIHVLLLCIPVPVICFSHVSHAFIVNDNTCKQQQLVLLPFAMNKHPFVTTSSSTAILMSTDADADSSNTDNEMVDIINIIMTQDFQLSTGVQMQVMSALPPKNTVQQTTGIMKPPILFLHGSFHGAWCWAEHFFPYFVARGYPVIAPNWRGTKGTFAGEGVQKVKIMEHVADLQSILDEVVPSILAETENQLPPVIVCHSFGGS